MPSRRRLATFMNDPDLAKGLKEVKARDGVPESEQIRRAIRAWLDTKGVLKQVTSRKRTKHS